MTCCLYSAGEWKVKDGQILAICNKSGHYKPGWMESARFLMDLDKMGVDLTKCTFELIGKDWISELTSSSNLSNLLSSEKKTSRTFNSEMLKIFLKQKLTDVLYEDWFNRSKKLRESEESEQLENKMIM